MTILGAVSFSLADFNGKATSVDFPFTNSSNALADITTWGQGLGTVLDAAVGSKVERMDTTLALVLPGGLKGAAVADVYASVTALIDFNAANTSNVWGLALPSAIPTDFTGELVNFGDANIIALVNYLKTTAANTRATDRYFNQINSSKRGSLRSRKRK